MRYSVAITKTEFEIALVFAKHFKAFLKLVLLIDRDNRSYCKTWLRYTPRKQVVNRDPSVE